MIDGQAAHFHARATAAHHIEIYANCSAAPCVILTESNLLERALDAFVDTGELINLAILQTINHRLIERARETGDPVHEALAFIPNPE
jgi:hypothetical protein